MQNPYANKNKLPHDSPMFFGRDAEIRNIRASLCKAYPESVSIIGERKIGKSSLANRIFHNFDTAPDTLSVFLDFDELSGHCNSQDEFFKHLNSRFSKCLEQKPNLGTQIEMFSFDSYLSFKSFVEKTASKRITTVIFIDEFEHLPDQKFADDSFFSNLRALANSFENRLPGQLLSG